MASWTTPVTHSSGDTLAVTDWNGIANNTTFLYQAPYASYYATAQTSISNAAYTQIALAGTDFSGYTFALTSNNAVVPLSGIYSVTGQVSVAAVANNIETAIYHQGSIFKYNSVSVAASGAAIPCSAIVKCVAADTIGLWAFQNSGGGTLNNTGSTVTYLAAYFIGST